MKTALFFISFCMSVSIGLAQGQSPRLVDDRCPAIIRQLADASAAKVACSWLQVSEDRDTSDDRTIRLFVLRIESAVETEAAPIVYLTGGPGDAATTDVGWWLDSALAQERDLILIDQRGSGLSQPSLNCPEFADTVDESRVVECRARLVEAGINLSAYYLAANVLDILDLLDALELEAVNLYGRSYGSRIALQIAREAPHRVKSMVLDGVYPESVNALEAMAANAQRALERLFDDCLSDAACRHAYPQLRERFEQAVTDLNAEPAKIDGLLPDAAVLMNGDDFVLLLRNLLEDSNQAPYLPALISAFAKRKYDSLSLPNFVTDSQDGIIDSHSEGAFLSLFCSDVAALTTSSRIREAGEGLPKAMSAVTDVALGLLSDCGLWAIVPSTAVSAGSQPIDVPTLILSGAYDPVTPLHWAELAAEGIAASRHVLFPSAGHGVLESEPCAEAITRAFLANPAAAPHADCLERLGPPEFYIREKRES